MTGLTRNHLVLYDSLPGGTGYLQRLVEHDGEEFRAVLAGAQEYLRECPCKKGPRQACHLCLLGYAPDRDYPCSTGARPCGCWTTSSAWTGAAAGTSAASAGTGRAGRRR
ncbi:DUF1998 domain-containing protein [Streptomyces albulus]|nr:DUF1998 domain-containing protein [Streptomyces noursei]